MINNKINVINRNSVMVVDSREVAENFDKRHNNVIRKIESTKKELLELFTQLDFELSNNLAELKNELSKISEYFIEDNYLDESGKLNKKYYLTQKGFDLVALSFTGPQALLYKILYIEEFHRMRNLLEESNKNYKVYIDDKKDKLEFIEHTEEENSDYTIDIGELANIISDKGIRIGRNKLFSILRKRRILKEDNLPYQQYINKNWFVVKTSYKVDKYGVERAYSKTLVTVKGQIEVFKLMKNQVNYGFGEVTVK